MTFAFFALGACLLVLPLVALAQVDLGLEQAAEIGLTTTDIRTVIARVINGFFVLLGLIIVILYMYGGFLWMTAGGDAGKVDQAKRVMINATVGLIIILCSYAIAYFIIRAVTGEDILRGGMTGTRPPSSSFNDIRSGVSGLLGNGIIEYHYPERGQADVPRNTNISITFKKPFLPSTIFADYEDAGTFELTDDTVGGVALADFLSEDTDGDGVPDNALMLNTDNLKLIPVDSLGDVSGDTPDARFDSRYPETVASSARVTAVNSVFDPLQGQTIVIDPIDLIGSAQADINYRVALRGGDNGILVWAANETTGAPESEPAFDAMNADGGYYWTFTTGTTLDLTPPQITYVGPGPKNPPGSDLIYRNELLQIYFDEAVDPTTASGIIGPEGGFTNIEIKARCREGFDPVRDCGGVGTTLEDIPGTLYIGNKYRTVEFMPDRPCEGVRENSCGEPVYCLPPNVQIRVRALASNLAAEPPAGIGNGVQDMVGNSLDGNDNGSAEGPIGGDLTDDYYVNDPQDDLTAVSDSAYWLYHVGTDIDLEPPVIIATDPLSHIGGVVDETVLEYEDVPAEGGVFSTMAAQQYPVDRSITAIWSKVMSISSMRTGGYLGGDTVFADERTTIALRAQERLKADFNLDCYCGDDADEGADTVCDPLCPEAEPPLDPPSFFISVGDGPVSIDGAERTMMQIEHRIFFTADELGYTENEATENTEFIPIYAPVIGARLRDTRQNCFYPSQGYDCPLDPACCRRGDVSCCSCCDRDPMGEFERTITCEIDEG